MLNRKEILKIKQKIIDLKKEMIKLQEMLLNEQRHNKH